MRRFGFVVGLLLTSAIVTLPAGDAVAEEKTEVEAAYVKVALTRDGKTYAHPGFRIVKDEQGVFVIEAEGKSHEVMVTLQGGDEDKLSVSVEYTVDGSSVLAEELSVAPGKDAEVGKGGTKLAINVDPRGKKNTSRKDEDKIDGPDSDDPLGGM